jgi:hypothetical protein|tara:strand:- start:922 stop:1596 length:675 start_codon:yes stop_codon:yes gene_type:complete
MELSENTLTVLKNFASINANIVMREGNVLKTVSEAKNLLASATILEDIPMTVGVYDLNEFLGVLGLVDTPRVDWKDTHVIVSDSSGRSKIKYFYSDIDMLTSPSKDITMPSVDVKFVLDNDVLNKIKRAASALHLTELDISGNNGVITLSVVDSANATSNTFSIDVDGEFSSENFNFILNISNLKMLPGNYEVEISSKLISHFTNTENKAQYWIALEKTSTYGE